jgi:putative hydrolase of the HAD superfamily
MTIRNVIFDFGGVLFRWRPREIVDAFYSDAAQRAALDEHVFRHSDWIDIDRGTIDEAEAAARFAARVGRPVEEMRALFDAVRAALVPIAGTVALLERLRARGLKLYALSNISEATFGHLRERHGFFDLFDGIVISAAVKLVKPEPAIFEHLRERFGLDFAASVFVDDLPPNVASARALGLRSILFESPEQCEAELAALPDWGDGSAR